MKLCMINIAIKKSLNLVFTVLFTEIIHSGVMNVVKIINKIEKGLNEIRPFLQSDGGNIELVDFDNGIVKVRLLGNCVDCSVNQMTLKNGVEMTIKKHAPSIKKVVSVE